jgi:hypothetical protein
MEEAEAKRLTPSFFLFLPYLMFGQILLAQILESDISGEVVP